jgi:DNA-binding LacI/PurR family transcriptional regulator
MFSTKPTIDDVARVAGVSRATASRVLNDLPGAATPTRARVHEAVLTLGFQPNETARALASGRQRAIDVIAIASGQEEGWLGVHPYYSRVLAGIMSVLEPVDVHLRLHAVTSDASPATIDAIAAGTSAGAVLATVTPAMASRFYRRCRRAVSLVATAAEVPAIEADNVNGAYTACRHLHRLGGVPVGDHRTGHRHHGPPAGRWLGRLAALGSRTGAAAALSRRGRGRRRPRSRTRRDSCSRSPCGRRRRSSPA